jgi:plasmid stability protein
MSSLITVKSNNCIDGGPLTIRNQDNSQNARLRLQAARHDHSTETETDLAQTPKENEPEQSLAVAIHKRLESIGVEELPIPVRQQVRTPPSFEE